MTSVNAWLTPDSLEGDLACLKIKLPSHLLLYVTGALSLLSEPENWESFGSILPADAAQFFSEFLLELEQGGCDLIPIHLRARLTELQSVPNNTLTGVPWTSAQWGFGDFVMDSNGTVIFEVQRDAYLVLTASYAFSTHGTGIRKLQIIEGNAGTLLAEDRGLPPAGQPSILNASWTGRLQPGDSILCRVSQNSGDSLNSYHEGEIPTLTALGYRLD